MVEINGMNRKKDELKKDLELISNLSNKEEPLPGIITTTESGPLRGTPDNNTKTTKQESENSN